MAALLWITLILCLTTIAVVSAWQVIVWLKVIFTHENQLIAFMMSICLLTICTLLLIYLLGLEKPSWLF